MERRPQSRDLNKSEETGGTELKSSMGISKHKQQRADQKASAKQLLSGQLTALPFPPKKQLHLETPTIFVKASGRMFHLLLCFHWSLNCLPRGFLACLHSVSASEIVLCQSLNALSFKSVKKAKTDLLFIADYIINHSYNYSIRVL